jgi:hypothetical protein
MKKIEFGRYSLPLYPKGTSFKFRVLNNLANFINEEQQCLLDALWNTRNDEKKFLESMNVLTYYFNQLNNPVDSDKFPSFTGTSQDSQDSNKSPIFEMPPLGR